MGQTVGGVGRGAFHWRDGWGGIPGEVAKPSWNFLGAFAGKGERQKHFLEKKVIKLSVPPGMHNSLFDLSVV